MVEEWFSSEDTAKILGVTMNNLRQIQFRGTLKWSKRDGRKVYYSRDDVYAYLNKRQSRASKVS